MKLALALLFALALPQARDAQRFHVDVTDDDGELVCTLQADNAPLHDVLLELSERAQVSLDGFDTSWRKTLISADLRKRPLRQVLTFVLGSVGLSGELRQGALHLREGLEASDEREVLYDAALASYLRVLRDFPEHALAAQAERSQAWIEVERGRLAAARAHYESLIEQHGSSELVPEALYECALLLMRDEAWQEASNRLSDLLRLEKETEYEFKARLELAWCVAELGEFERALYMIDALDAVEPPTTDAEELRRGLVRVRTMAGLGQGKAALELLDDLDARLVDGESRGTSLELRAIACRAAGRIADAARAWVSYSELVDGPRRAHALSNAAQLALEADDEIGAMFIAQLAKDSGVDLTATVREARTRLSLDQLELTATTLAQRVARAERLLAGGLAGEALEVLQPLQAQVAGLDEDSRVRFSLAYGRALEREVGVDAALEHFRDALPHIESPDARVRIYLLAAELLEAQGRLDDAIEAYRGRI